MTTDPVAGGDRQVYRNTPSASPPRPLFVNIIIIVLTLAFSAGVFLGLELAR